MAERLVYGYVVVAPRVVACCSGFDSGAGASGDGSDVYRAVDEEVLSQREECQLYCGGEASGVGDVSCSADDAFAVQFGQSVYEVVCSVFDAVVGAEVDDAGVFGRGVFGEELSCGAVWCAAEQAVDVGVVDV